MDFKLGNYRIIFVVCLEAGAAEAVSSFIKNKVIGSKNCYNEIKYCLDGPAIGVFKRKLGNIVMRPLEDIKNLVSGRDIIFTGRSLIPELEREAIKLAKANKIKVVTFLDHWVNYEGSFIPVPKKNKPIGRDLLKYLPDEIIVGDAYAVSLIKKTRIPRRFVRFAENEYFNDVKVFFGLKNLGSKRRLLYLSEPIYGDLKKIYGNGNIWGFNEFDMMQDIINAVSIFKEMGFKELIIRLHPNEKKEKYIKIINKADFKNLNIIFSKEKMLEDDIKKVSMVIGMESMGLVIALLAGKKVISYLPKKTLKKCVLPYKELIKINDLNLLKKIRL